MTSITLYFSISEKSGLCLPLFPLKRTLLLTWKVEGERLSLCVC